MCRTKQHGGQRCDRNLTPDQKKAKAAKERIRYHNRKEENQKYFSHINKLGDTLKDMVADGQETFELYTYTTHVNGNPVMVWDEERENQHINIINDILDNSKHVKNDHKALMSGGLGGAGKSTVLNKFAGVDTGEYVTINPDDIKEIMAERGMIPEVEGFSPMEVSPLVHEEASHISKVLTEKLLLEGKNVIFDVTMGSEKSTAKKIEQAREAGYSLSAIFVDISPETSVIRAKGRHKEGYDLFQKGEGYGGRFLPEHIVLDQKTDDKRFLSSNAEIFYTLQQSGAFDEAQVFNNNVHGAAPTKMGINEWVKPTSNASKSSAKNATTSRVNSNTETHYTNPSPAAAAMKDVYYSNIYEEQVEIYDHSGLSDDEIVTLTKLRENPQLLANNCYSVSSQLAEELYSNDSPTEVISVLYRDGKSHHAVSMKQDDGVEVILDFTAAQYDSSLPVPLVLERPLWENLINEKVSAKHDTTIATVGLESDGPLSL